MQFSLTVWLLFSCASVTIISSLETKSHASITSRDIKDAQENESEGKSSDADRNQHGFKVENIAQSASESATKKFRVNNDGIEKTRKVPLITLLGRQESPQCQNASIITCNASATYRTFDGTCNNLEQPHLGQAGSCHRRVLAAEYDDGVSAPRTKSNMLPNPRKVCIAVHRTPLSDQDKLDPQFSALFMSFGQFIDHDLTLTALTTLDVPFTCCPINQADSRACFPVFLGNSDPDFPNNCMNFTRSRECVQCSVNARQQMNSLTAFMDCSHIYGLTEDQANILRSSNNDGKLNTQFVQGVGELLPPNNATTCGCPASCCQFRTGDTRSNQNMLLILLHTVFVLFHNLVVTSLRSFFPAWGNERLYQESRKFVIACFQHISYNDYLPILLGSDDMAFFRLHDMNTRYDAYQDPRTINECMTAAFRLHSTVPDIFTCLTGTGSSAIPLANNFFNVNPFYMEGRVNCIASGSFRQQQQSFDPLLAPSVNRFLYLRQNDTPPRLDLCTLNIQRGRDHGIPGYTAYANFCLGIRIRSFDDLRQLLFDKCVARYKNLYSSVHDVDLWSALQCEIRSEYPLLGPVSRCLVGMQFYGTKYGDRFFWTHRGERGSLTSSQKDFVSNMTLERILCDTLKLKKIPLDVFAWNAPAINCDDPTLPPLDMRKWGK